MVTEEKAMAIGMTIHYIHSASPMLLLPCVECCMCISHVYKCIFLSDCAVLGDPCGQLNISKVHLTNFTQRQVMECEQRANSPEKLCLELLMLLFTNEELAHGNCTRPVRDDIIQMDSEHLWAIKCKINVMPL